MNKENVWTALLASMVRKIITYIAGLLMASGWINADLHDRLTTEAVTLITGSIVAFLISTYLSYRNVIWEFLKTHVAKLLPPTASMDDIVQVAERVEDKAAVAKGRVKAEDIEQLTGVRGR